MGAVSKFEDQYQSIQTIYVFTVGLTIAAIVEAVLKGETSALPHFLIYSTIGFGLFWSIEFAARQVVLPEKTEQTKRVLRMIYLGRYMGLGVLLYFLFNFLFTSTGIVPGLLACFTICVTYFVGNWFNSKLDNTKRVTNVKMFSLASSGLIIVLAFCIGFFGGRWLGGYWGNAEIGSYIGLALGFVAALVQGLRVEKQRREAAQKVQDTKEENLLRLNNDSSLF